MKQVTKILTLGLAMTLGVSSLSGCTATSEEDYSKMVVATYGDQNIYLDEANFNARYYQYLYESFYASYYGSDFWSTDTGSGTMEENLKENIMAEIFQTYVLLEHADEYEVSLSDADKEKVESAVSDFLDSSDENLIEAANATEELVTKIYTNNALANKVWQAVVAGADTEVSDEDARQVTVKYVLISDDNETYTDGEATATEIADKVKAGTDIDTVCEDYDGLSATEGSYYKNGENDTDLGKEAATLSTGETVTYQLEGTGWYVIYCTTDDDKDAAEEAKEDIIEDRQNELFETTYSGWTKKKFKVDEDVWAEITFDKNMIYEVETEAETTTEATTEVTTESSTEATTVTE